VVIDFTRNNCHIVIVNDLLVSQQLICLPTIKVGPNNVTNGGATNASGTSNVSTHAHGSSVSSAGSRRITLMCMTVASCFTLTSLPLSLVVLLVGAGYRNAATNYSQQLTTLRTMNACIDPIIYGLMWRPFRKSIRQV